MSGHETVGSDPPAPSQRPPVVWSPRYEADIGVHVFPTEKYRLTFEALQELANYGPDEFLEPSEPTRGDLLLAHSSVYVDDLEAAAVTPRTIHSELPVTHEVIGAFRLAAGGSLLAMDHAVRCGTAVHLGGGLHHAFAGHAEGFCYVNDIAIAARGARRDHGIDRVAVVDVDVHQGNGTAAIFRNDDSVFTFSIHQENNYPLKQRSDVDVGLADGAGDEEYLATLGRHIGEIRREFEPELVIYVAGADPYREDQLGGLDLTIEGLRARDRLVFDTFRPEAAVMVVLAGGYARRLEDTVTIHTNTCLEAIGGFEDRRSR